MAAVVGMGGRGAATAAAGAQPVVARHVGGRRRGQLLGSGGGYAVAEAAPNGARARAGGRWGRVCHGRGGSESAGSGQARLRIALFSLSSLLSSSFKHTHTHTMHLPRVVIIGGGQGGVNVAQGLAGVADVTLVDR